MRPVQNGGPAVAAHRPLSYLISGGGLWLRTRTIGLHKKSLFNFHRDLIQPSFGAVVPVLAISDFCLQFSYPVLGGAKLRRQLLSGFDGLLLGSFSGMGCLMKQAQNCMPRLVDGIINVLPSVQLWRKRHDHLGRA